MYSQTSTLNRQFVPIAMDQLRVVHRELAAFRDKPRPAGAEFLLARFGVLFDQRLKVIEIAIDGFLQLATGLGPSSPLSPGPGLQIE
jgi:hypothetical protein